MVRWKNTRARLILLVLCATFLTLALDPLIEWGIVRSGRAVTGTEVKIDSMQTSWTDKTIFLRGFHAADPVEPQREVFAADEIKLQIDGTALVRRQIRIPRAQVSGLSVNTDRRIPGILEADDASSYGKVLTERFVSESGLWLETVGQRLSEQLDRRQGSSELVDQLLERWPAEYDALESTAAHVRDRIATLQQALSSSGHNPLRNTAVYDSTSAQLESLGQDLTELRSTAERLQQQMLLDRDTVEALRQRERQTLSNELPSETLNADHLSEYLLGPEISGRVATLTQWVRWSRRFLPSMGANSTGLPGRGVDVALPGIEPQPDILIDTLVLNGQAIAGDQPLQIEGTIRGLSSPPDRCQRPAEVVIQTTGGTQLLIQAELRGAGPQTRDRFVVNCPNWRLDERTLGDVSQLAFTVAPAEAHFWLSINVDGDLLSGEMVMKQEGVRSQPIMGQWLQATPASTVVADAIAKVNSIETQVAISGTLDNPQWKLRSNLGHQLAQHLQQGLEAHCVAQCEGHELSNQSRQRQQLADTMSQLSQRHAQVLGVIDESRSAIQTATSQVATRFGPDGGLSSPFRDTIRR